MDPSANRFVLMESASDPSVVLVTGAAGHLGRALVREFAGTGWRVAAGCHSKTGEFPAAENIWSFQMDVTKAIEVEGAVQEILKRWGRVDVLINNAGLVRDKLLTHLTDEDWDEVLRTNLQGALLCSKAVLRSMVKRRAGHLINIGSWSGRAGAVGQANYAAAKAGILGLTTSLAREVGSRNICVNAVLPGVLPSKMTANLSAEQMSAFASANALGRINSAEEVARFIVFLTSLRNVSGQIFQLDSRIGPWS